MARKTAKTKKEVKSNSKRIIVETKPTNYRIKLAESQIELLIKRGKEKGYLTYEEMNEELPEEAVSPARLDRLLMTLDEAVRVLVDEAVPPDLREAASAKAA